MKTFREYINETSQDPYTISEIKTFLKSNNLSYYRHWAMELLRRGGSFSLDGRYDKTILIKFTKRFPYFVFSLGRFTKGNSYNTGDTTEIYYEPAVDIEEVRSKINKILINIDKIDNINFVNKHMDELLSRVHF